MYPRNQIHADCIVFEGSNMAECHPIAFRWSMQAKLKGATLIHVDPRFTRTSAMCDIHVPVRAGSDIAFLGGLINYVLNSERWNNDRFFQDFLVNYTNAATIVREDFQDTEDLNGVFSGLHAYTEKTAAWKYDGFVGEYENSSWQYAGAAVGEQGEAASGAAQTGETAVRSGPPDPPQAPSQGGPPFEELVRSLRKGMPERDETLQHPRTILQILKRHYRRYTPDMVEQVTGCPPDVFLNVAATILANSGRDRTTTWCYALGWTQHTYGPQMIGTCALLQLLLGNIGRPGGRRHGVTRPRLHPGVDRRSHPLPQHPRLHAGAFGAEAA
jgi:formate dehydrogenase major subunit